MLLTLRLDIIPSLPRIELAPSVDDVLLNNEETILGENRSGNVNHGSGFCWSLYHLARFELKRLLRSPLLAITHIVVSIAMSSVVGLVYYKMQNDLKGTLNRLFSLFTMMTFCALMGTSAVSLFQGIEKLRYLRERASGYYSTLSYLMTRMFFDDLFLRLIPSITFSVIAYKMINYEKVWTEDDFYNSTSKTILPGSVCSASKMPFQRLGACADELNKAAISRNLSVTELMELNEVLSITTSILYTDVSYFKHIFDIMCYYWDVDIYKPCWDICCSANDLTVHNV